MSPSTRICTETEPLPVLVEGFSYREGRKNTTIAVAMNSPAKVDVKMMVRGDILVQSVLLLPWEDEKD